MYRSSHRASRQRARSPKAPFSLAPHETIIDNPRMITYAEAAQLLCVDKRTLRRRVAAGRYIAYGDGRGRVLLYSSIIADIQRNNSEVR